MTIEITRPAIHPGEHLQIDLEELGMSQRHLASEIGVPANRVSAIVNGQRSITADTALRLVRWMGTTPEYWLNLQSAYDLRRARQEAGERIEAEVTPRLQVN